jgi:RecA-family ATPase
MALAVARGGQALGNRPVNPGEALYLALEDHERRLQDRLLQLVHDQEAPRTLFFA